MRIISQTSSQLKLVSRPYLWTLAFLGTATWLAAKFVMFMLAVQPVGAIGAAFFLLLCAMAVLETEFVDITLDKPTNEVRITRRSMLGQLESTYALDTILDIGTEGRMSYSLAGLMDRVVLRFHDDAGSVPLSHHSFGPSLNPRLAGRLRSWLDLPAPARPVARQQMLRGSRQA